MSGSFCLNDLAVDFVPERPLLNSLFHIYMAVWWPEGAVPR